MFHGILHPLVTSYPLHIIGFKYPTYFCVAFLYQGMGGKFAGADIIQDNIGFTEISVVTVKEDYRYSAVQDIALK